MQNRWSELSDDVESLIFELEEREDSAWIREANTCVFIGHSLLL